MAFDRDTPDESDFSRDERGSAAFRPEIVHNDRVRPTAFGVGKFGSGIFSPRDVTRYLWSRVKAALTAFAILFVAGQALAADTYTTYLNLRKPAVDVEDTEMPYGDKLNNNADLIDAAIGGIYTSSGALQAQIAVLSTSTEALRVQLLAVGASTAALSISTETLRAMADALGVSTEALRVQLLSVGASTAALSSSTSTLSTIVDALGVSTDTLNTVKASTGASSITSLPQFIAGGLNDGAVLGQDIAVSTINLVRLYQSGCSLNEVVQWDGTRWACGTAGVGDAVLSADQTWTGYNQYTNSNGLVVTTITHTGTDDSRAAWISVSSQCTTSTSFVTIFTTITVVAPVPDRYLVRLNGNIGTANSVYGIAVFVDGDYDAPQTSSVGFLAGTNPATTRNDVNAWYITSTLAAGTHNFMLGLKTDGGSLCINGALTQVVIFSAEPWR
jgi:hypothetical protein